MEQISERIGSMDLLNNEWADDPEDDRGEVVILKDEDGYRCDCEGGDLELESVATPMQAVINLFDRYEGKLDYDMDVDYHKAMKTAKAFYEATRSVNV